jgi:hypothetical protein
MATQQKTLFDTDPVSPSRFVVPPGVAVDVRRRNDDSWHPHTTQRATGFNRYESCDLGRYVFRQGNWELRAWGPDVRKRDNRPLRSQARKLRFQ